MKTHNEGVMFRNPEERERLLLEAVTRGLVKTHLTEKTNCVL
jgi:hypothetical protein